VYYFWLPISIIKNEIANIKKCSDEGLSRRLLWGGGAAVPDISNQQLHKLKESARPIYFSTLISIVLISFINN